MATTTDDPAISVDSLKVFTNSNAVALSNLHGRGISIFPVYKVWRGNGGNLAVEGRSRGMGHIG
jgi:hypothetical protein